MYVFINVGYFGVFVLIVYQFLESCAKDNFLYVLYFIIFFHFVSPSDTENFVDPPHICYFLMLYLCLVTVFFSQPIYPDKSNIISFQFSFIESDNDKEFK
jgi:hypothetical protein